MEYLKCWIMREWKNVNINWWWGTMGGGEDLEMADGGGEKVMHSKLILMPQMIINKNLHFWPNLSKILLTSVFQNWHKIYFLLHFHVCCFSINRYEWMKFFYGGLIFWVSNQKDNVDIVQKPHWISMYSWLWIINIEKVSI